MHDVTALQVMDLVGIFVAFLFALNVIQCQEISQNSICGSPRRISGNDDDEISFKRGDSPWIVALTSTLTSPPTFICTGTLISSSHVITGKR